jgi:hypothetical protein
LLIETPDNEIGCDSGAGGGRLSSRGKEKRVVMRNTEERTKRRKGFAEKKSGGAKGVSMNKIFRPNAPQFQVRVASLRHAHTCKLSRRAGCVLCKGVPANM